jgi:hypothetical protein
MDSNEIGLLGALGGAIIGGACSLIASLWAHKLESDANKAEEIERTISEIKSLRSEISQSYQIYDDELGVTLRNLTPLEPLMAVLPIGENPFPFFDSMPACLTKMQPNTVDQVFNWYLRSKGLVRQTQDNNNNVSRALKFASEEVIQTQLTQIGSFNIEPRMDSLNIEILKNYAQRNGMLADGQALKTLHDELTRKTAIVLDLLDQELKDRGALLKSI